MLKIQELDPTKKEYALESLNDHQSREYMALLASVISVKRERGRFWRERLETGKRCQEYLEGRIFTDAQYDQYLGAGKVPVEPREMKPVVNSLWELIKGRKRPGQVAIEDSTPPEGVAPAEVMDVVLMSFKNRLGVNRLADQALKEGLTVPFPVWIWFDHCDSENGARGELKATRYPWDAVLPEPFMAPDGSDIQDVVLIGMETEAGLVMDFPDREDLIKKIVMQGTAYSSDQFDDAQLPFDASVWYDLLFESCNGNDHQYSGYHTIVKWVRKVRHKIEKWVDFTVGEVVKMPETWSDEDKTAWQEAHRTFEKREEWGWIRWETTATTSGIILDNRPCWYQGDEMPGVCYLADMVNKKPTSPVDDLLGYMFSLAVSETEGLAQVQSGNGQVTYVKEGAVLSVDTLREELSAEKGVVSLSEGHDKNSIHTETRKANTVFLEYSDRTRNQLQQVHHINEAMRGAGSASQSGVAQQSMISQGMTVQSPYVDNFTNMDLALNRFLLKAIPMIYTAEEVVRIDDDFGGQKEAVMNESEMELQQDQETGEMIFVAKVVANDITSANYRYEIIPGDNSPLGREREMTKFIDTISAIGNTLFNIDPGLAANILLVFPNRYAKEAGKLLKQKMDEQSQSAAQMAQMEAQAESEKMAMKYQNDIRRSTVPQIIASLTAKDVEENPNGAGFLAEMLAQQQAMARENWNEKPQQPTGEADPMAMMGSQA